MMMRKVRKFLFLVCFASTLCGCGIYGRYQSEAQPVKDSISNKILDPIAIRQLDGLPKDGEIPTFNWNEFFVDTLLQKLIQQGLEKNTDLRIALQKVKEAEATMFSSRLSFLPNLIIGVQGAEKKYGSLVSEPYAFNVNSSWELDFFGKLANNTRSAREQLESNRDYVQAVRTRLICNIADYYYTLLFVDKCMEIYRETIKTWQQDIEMLESMNAPDANRQLAVRQLKANILYLQKKLRSTRSQIPANSSQLCILIGEPIQNLERGRFDDVLFPQNINKGIDLVRIMNRPDIRQAEHNLAAAAYATRVARSSFYPTVTLSGTIGWTNSGGQGISNPSNWLWNAVGQLAQPIFQRGALLAKYKISKAKQEEALLTFYNVLLKAGDEVNSGLGRLESSYDCINYERERVCILQEAVQESKLHIDSLTTYLELLTAEESLLSAKIGLVESKYANIQSTIKLYRALGGE